MHGPCQGKLMEVQAGERTCSHTVTEGDHEVMMSHLAFPQTCNVLSYTEPVGRCQACSSGI